MRLSRSPSNLPVFGYTLLLSCMYVMSVKSHLHCTFMILHRRYSYTSSCLSGNELGADRGGNLVTHKQQSRGPSQGKGKASIGACLCAANSFWKCLTANHQSHRSIVLPVCSLPHRVNGCPVRWQYSTGPLMTPPCPLDHLHPLHCGGRPIVWHCRDKRTMRASTPSSSFFPHNKSS